MTANKPVDTPVPLVAIAVGGPDARDFLQSQLTADVNALAADGSTPAAWCDSKGRVVATLRLLVHGSDYLVAVPEAMSDAIAKRLSMYRIGRKLTLSGARPLTPGELAGEAVGGARPDADSGDAVFHHPEKDGGGRAWRNWLSAEIDAGMPWILPATSERFLPQMLGLERLGGLSYRKGCYPGQEVIARVHYRGRVTRKLARFEADGPVGGPGEPIRLDGFEAVVLYSLDTTSADGASRGLMIVPAEVESGTFAGSEGAIRVMVELDHAVLPSGS